MIKIAIASDHAGFFLKEKIIEHFSDFYKFIDYGCNNSKDSVDYPDITQNLCQEYLSNDFSFGILICGSGIGVSIAANRFNKIRAALCHSKVTAILAREHNDANILCLGSRIIKKEDALEMVKSFLETSFSNDRHSIRVKKLEVSL